MPEDLSLLGLLISKGVSSYFWKIGKRLNRNNLRKLIDPKTNEGVILKSNHSLFFSKNRKLRLILGIISVLLFITELIGE